MYIISVRCTDIHVFKPYNPFMPFFRHAGDRRRRQRVCVGNVKWWGSRRPSIAPCATDGMEGNNCNYYWRARPARLIKAALEILSNSCTALDAINRLRYAAACPLRATFSLDGHPLHPHPSRLHVCCMRCAAIFFNRDGNPIMGFHQCRWIIRKRLINYQSTRAPCKINKDVCDLKVTAACTESWEMSSRCSWYPLYLHGPT